MGSRLSYADGLFIFATPWFTNTAATKDTPNFLTTASSTSPWSDPVFINSSGFDPS